MKALSVVSALASLVIGFLPTQLAERSATTTPSYCRAIESTRTVDSIPPGYAAISVDVINADCSINHQPPMFIAQGDIGTVRNVHPKVVLAKGGRDRLAVGWLYQWLRDGAGLELNELQLSVSWTYTVGGALGEAMAVVYPEYAQDGWSSTNITVSYPAAGTAKGHGEFLFSGGFHNYYDNTVVYNDTGGATCTWTYHFDQGFPGWSFSNLCWSTH